VTDTTMGIGLVEATAEAAGQLRLIGPEAPPSQERRAASRFRSRGLRVKAQVPRTPAASSRAK